MLRPGNVKANSVDRGFLLQRGLDCDCGVGLSGQRLRSVLVQSQDLESGKRAGNTHGSGESYGTSKLRPVFQSHELEQYARFSSQTPKFAHSQPETLNFCSAQAKRHLHIESHLESFERVA